MLHKTGAGKEAKMNKDEKKSKYCKKDLIILALIFIIVILFLVIIWAMATKSNEQFYAEFSFAATISSIILSIIAIGMSIAGSARMELIYNRAENEVVEITNVRKDIKTLIGKITKKIDAIKSDTDQIRSCVIAINDTNKYVITETPENSGKGKILNNEDIEIQGKPFGTERKEGE